jgi:hypothetical protein
VAVPTASTGVDASGDALEFGGSLTGRQGVADPSGLSRRSGRYLLVGLSSPGVRCDRSGCRADASGGALHYRDLPLQQTS